MAAAPLPATRSLWWTALKTRRSSAAYAASPSMPTAPLRHPCAYSSSIKFDGFLCGGRLLKTRSSATSVASPPRLTAPTTAHPMARHRRPSAGDGVLCGGRFPKTRRSSAASAASPPRLTAPTTAPPMARHYRQSRCEPEASQEANARRRQIGPLGAVAMKGGRRSNGAATDLLVCFPSRAYLALMPPKAICSPSRPSASEQVKRRHSTSQAGPLPSSALFKAASRNPSRRAVDVSVDDEPSSPKVTCAGQIKARPARPKVPGAGGKPKKATWLQALGIKKDALPFLNALHGAFRLNVAGCFGNFPGAVEYTSGEDDEEEEVELAGKETEHDAALAMWFMVLEEGKKVSIKRQEQEPQEEEPDTERDAAPPANALMLMRCRSAPAKGLARRLGGEAEEDVEVKRGKKKREEEEKERLVLMSYAPDFFKVSVDITKETWIVGGDDAILRCRSWKS